LLYVIIFISSCDNNDDFATYKHKTFNIEEYLNNEKVNTMSKLIPYATLIVNEYVEGLNLTEIVFETEDLGLTGKIQFNYVKVHEFKNQIESISLFFDLTYNKFYFIEYIKGHGKRINVITEKISDTYLNVTFTEIFESDKIIHDYFHHTETPSVFLPFTIVKMSYDRIKYYQFWGTSIHPGETIIETFEQTNDE